MPTSFRARFSPLLFLMHFAQNELVGRWVQNRKRKKEIQICFMMFLSQNLLEAEKKFCEVSLYLCLVPMAFCGHLLSVAVDSTVLEELNLGLSC